MHPEANAAGNHPIPRQLPIVIINGKQYFADERLRECRAIDNPHDRIPLDEALVFLLNPPRCEPRE
jgi:hypothetical protein